MTARLATGLRRVNLAGALVILGVLAAWEGAARSELVRLDYLPPPSVVLSALLDLLQDGQVLADLLHTTIVVLVAWLIAVAIGGLLGLLIGLSTPLRVLCMSSVDVLRSLPVVAFIPVVLLLLGPTQQMEVAVAAYAAIWPCLINTLGGVASVHPRLLEAATTFRLGPLATLWKIVLPAAAPSILVGARLSMGIAFVVTVVAEMVGNPAGVGYGLVTFQMALRPDALWAYVAVSTALGVLLSALVESAAGLIPATKER